MTYNRMPNGILVLGSGGREHAICSEIRNNSIRGWLAAHPGNFGTSVVSDHNISHINKVLRSIKLVIPGSEQFLADGIVDDMRKKGILCCGPTKAAARLESSKAFAREIAHCAEIPSPGSEVVKSKSELESKVRSMEEKYGTVPVVKADGLAAGKGVFLPNTTDECIKISAELLDGKLGDAGKIVVLEERLDGKEISLFYACDKDTYIALPTAKDHKRVFDGNNGPNTGGMGAISPSPDIDAKLSYTISKTIVEPTLAAMIDRGIPFTGFLYLGVMLTEDGPKLLEYNVRLGDPEAQVILPRFEEGNFLEMCFCIAEGDLKSFTPRFKDNNVADVVLAAEGYPGDYRKGDLIVINESALSLDNWLIYSGLEMKSGDLFTSGGRVMSVVAEADTMEDAVALAYKGVSNIHFFGMHYRSDIGR